MSEWIRVEDRHPVAGQVVLAYFPGRIEMPINTEEWMEYHESPVAFSSASICVGEGWAESEYEEISHWQPLPEPPTT